MSSRQEQLSEIQKYIKEIDNKVTMILQSLQWDRKYLLQSTSMVLCKYDTNHRIPTKNKKEHEEKCVLKSQGYASDDIFLPEAFHATANTIVQFSPENIQEIINYASKIDPLFKRGNTSVVSEPLTVERLQVTYTADERRAIHDAVVNAVPSCHDLSDLALKDLAGDTSGPTESKRKSKLEILAELRNMKRRRTKYRVAAPTRNYSHVLRDLITTQMEMYKEVQEVTTSTIVGNQGDVKNLKDGEGTKKHSIYRLDNNLHKSRDDKHTCDDKKRNDNKRRNYDYTDSRHSRKLESGKRDRYDNNYHDRHREIDREDGRRIKSKGSYNEREVGTSKHERYGNRDSMKSDKSRDSNIHRDEKDRHSSSSRDRNRYHTSERRRYYDDEKQYKKEREYSFIQKKIKREHE